MSFTLRRAGIVVAVATIAGAAAFFAPWGQTPMHATERTVTSKDGTTIAYEQSGDGPPVILVAPALADRDGTAKLGRLLAARFTILNYDRRGRGRSTDTLPYAVDREIEDIDALIHAAGGSACLFGSSSGAALALEAANRLGTKVTRLFLYEPPFIVDNSRPPMPDRFSGEIQQLVQSGRNGDAVKLFFTKGMGIPPIFVTLMRVLMPGWSKMVAAAHTIPYDLAVLSGTQTGRPLPAGRWASTQAPTLVMVGGKSEPFFHSGAKALVQSLPHAEYRALQGRDHSAVMFAPRSLASAVQAYFLSSQSAALESR